MIMKMSKRKDGKQKVVKNENIDQLKKEEVIVIGDNVNDKKMMFKVIKNAFMQRRKTLVNGITNSGLMKKEEIKELLKKVGLEENVRGENLTMRRLCKTCK